jgi:Type ISP C-terminal specificity domain
MPFCDAFWNERRCWRLVPRFVSGSPRLPRQLWWLRLPTLRPSPRQQPGQPEPSLTGRVGHDLWPSRHARRCVRCHARFAFGDILHAALCRGFGGCVPAYPFPSAHSVFERAAEIGREIRAVETFARKPGDAFLTPKLARQESDANGVLADSIDLKDGEIILCADGPGRMSGIPEHIWQFAVSGYRLLPRWLGARAGQEVDRAFIKQVRDVAGRIAELIDLFDRADNVLVDALVETVTRKKLGLE